ncbi:hypothetical protein Tco_0705603 [Tanacetum coccineum]|uniref:Transposase (Putative), gypsy type n=1 Tax=Tanacetum coccineum TaxID=301880 RepID=A0ABQ4Y753_9ASTR
MGRGLAQRPEDLDGDGERGFDCLTFALVLSKAHREGCRASRGGFPYWLRRGGLQIGGEAFEQQRCGLSAKELNEFLSFYPIPSEYDVIFPTSTQTIFDAPPGYVGLYIHSFYLANLRLPLTDFLCEMAFRNFIYTKDDNDLAFLPKEPSPGFGTGSPSTLVNTELLKDVEEPKVQPAELTADSWESPKAGVFIVHPRSVASRIKERNCKTRGGSSRPPIKRKLASRSSSSCVVRTKTFASKDDAPIPSIYDDDEGLPDCFELKDANAYHLKTFPITSLAWKGHLDNQMDLELLDLHDRCYARQAMMDNAVNKRAGEFLQVIKKMSGEADVNKARERSNLRQKISSLTADVKEHKGNLDRMMLESQKWVGYQVTLLALESKVDSLEAEKARLEAVEASLHREVEELKQDRRDVVSKVVPYAAMKLVHSDELGKLVGTLVSSAITYGRCRAYEQVAAMKEPFDLSKAKGYRSSYKKEHTQASNDFACYVPLAG